MDGIQGTRAESHDLRRDPMFARSLTPMLIADDERRHVDANDAACLFLRLPRHEICELRIDDLIAARQHPGLQAMWSDLLHGGGSNGAGRTAPWDLRMPDGTSVAVNLCATPHIRPGRHLLCVGFPAACGQNGYVTQSASPAKDVLTKREREILTLVALGNTGVQIARQLFLSPATVASHVTNALIKLNARNRAHGIAIALQSQELNFIDGSRDGLRSPGRNGATADRPLRAGLFGDDRQPR